jgi:peptidoglycan hydrolase CwlO-like protein
MSTDENILKAIEGLQADVTSIKDVQQKQGKQIEGLQTYMNGLYAKVDSLDKKVGTLDMKVDSLELRIEAVHVYQKQAHKEIMDSLFESNEVNSHAQKALEKRVDRIEKHLGLPPLK